MIYKYIRESEIWNIIGEASTNNMMNAEYAYTAQNVYLEWGVLMGMGLLFALIGGLFLTRIDKDGR